MFTLVTCLVFIIFKAEAKDYATDSQITFKIHSMPLNESTKYIICDHTENKMQQNKYTVLEGEEFTIITDYYTYVDYFICNDYVHINDLFKKTYMSNFITLKAEKTLGTLWKCTILVDRGIPTFLPQVEYDNNIYSVAYCYMKIHMRQRISPQTILVNNMVLQVVRTDPSEKNVDFTAEYQYADGDVVNVTCANFLIPAAPLMLEYVMAGTMSNISAIEDLSSYSSRRVTGFVAKLHSGHNNSYIICTNTEPTDYTKVMVKLVMRTEFNIVNVRMNRMTLRPKLKNVVNNYYYYYEIEYKFSIFQPLIVVCEVQRTDMNLVVDDRIDFNRKEGSYQKTDLNPRKAEMMFYLHSGYDKKFSCVSKNKHINGTSVEQVTIHLTEGKFVDPYPMNMEFSSNGTLMELYNDQLKVIYYEFNDGETLQLKCHALFSLSNSKPNLYLQFKDSDKYETNGTISKTLHVTHEDGNNEVVCYLKAQVDPFDPREIDLVLREIRVILRERVLTTTSTTTTAADPSSVISSNTLVYCMSAVGVVAVIIISVILYLTFQKRFCLRRPTSQDIPPTATPRPDPNTVFYLNLLSVFQPMNEREAAELENHYEEIE